MDSNSTNLSNISISNISKHNLILIIEDEPDIAMMERALLEKEGYSCILAESSILGIEKHNELKPNLIILDIGMPEMDGLDVAREIRTKDEKTPILGITGYDMVLTPIEVKKAGFTQILMKPVNPTQVLRCVRVLLEHGKGKWLKSEEFLKETFV